MIDEEALETDLERFSAINRRRQRGRLSDVPGIGWELGILGIHDVIMSSSSSGGIELLRIMSFEISE